MGISAGTRLGPYQIVALLGAGGMGEVYRARDTRLGRDVAVKVLPPHIASHADARARFDREARAISALNHPNICTLFDVGTEGDTAYLVMELIDGESLAAQLARGRPPLDHALRYAIDIAAALDKAHRQGIVHRDLKPGNVMITRTGVKLLDFGLAHLANPAPEMGPEARTAVKPLTTEGTIVGTLHYMSPEQMEGKATDARTDIFAFGCVLYEMLAGRRAFDGSSEATVIGAIMHSEPQPLSELAPIVSPALGRLVQKCLAKSADDRWQNAGDLVTELQWSLQEPMASAPRARPPVVPWAVAIVSILVAIAFAGITLSRRATAPLMRLSVPLDGSQLVISHGDNPLAVSPDGKFLAFMADSGGKRMLHLRNLADGSVVPIPGTESARTPTWAPDSSQIAFVSGSKLMKTTPRGENPTKICDAAGARFASWGRDGTIVFVAQDRLHRVGAGGGTPEDISIAPLPAGAGPAWPVFVDSNRVAYCVILESNEIRLHVVSLKKMGDDRDLGTVDSRFEIVDGALLFVRDGVLMAQRVDRDLGRTSEPVQLAPGVTNYSTIGLADFSASPNVIAYVGNDTDARATWFDRSGAILGSAGPIGAENPPRISRDGARLVIGATDPRSGTDDLWVCDVARDTCARITDTKAGEILPAWSPDGTLIAFGTDATNSISTIRTDGRNATIIARIDRNPFLGDWSPDGKSLILFGSKGDASIGLLEPRPGAVMTAGRAAAFACMFPRVSPDGRWIAYGSSASGELETWLAPFGRDGDAIQVSSGGGGSPAWRGDGRELYYATQDHRMNAVDVLGTSPLRVGAPRLLFRSPEGTWDGFDVMPGGDRFVVTRVLAGPATRPINLIVNWRQLLGAVK